MQRATGGDEPVGEGRVHKDGKAWEEDVVNHSASCLSAVWGGLGIAAMLDGH